ncbi:iron chelate uptake ABC transporter family permease subunit, partial [Pseudomonas viridiflava]
MDKHLTLRYRGFSRRFSLAGLTRLLAVLAFTLLVMLGSLALGKVNLSPATLFDVLFGQADQRLVFIVEQLRMPRLALAALVGAALAVSGLILQSIIRNPLASPDLLGITSGASAAAVIYLSFFSAALGAQFLPLAAISGAGLAALAIYLLAWNQGASPLRLVLIGVGVSALLAAVTTFILVFSPLTTTL